MEDYEQSWDGLFSLDFDINAIKALKSVIDYSLKTWPGSPQRPCEEQEFLWMMRDLLNKCIMEHSFHNLNFEG